MNAKEPLFCRQRQIEEVLLEEVLQKIAADMILPAAIRTLWFPLSLCNKAKVSGYD